MNAFDLELSFEEEKGSKEGVQDARLDDSLDTKIEKMMKEIKSSSELSEKRSSSNATSIPQGVASSTDSLLAAFEAECSSSSAVVPAAAATAKASAANFGRNHGVSESDKGRVLSESYYAAKYPWSVPPQCMGLISTNITPKDLKFISKAAHSHGKPTRTNQWDRVCDSSDRSSFITVPASKSSAQAQRWGTGISLTTRTPKQRRIGVASSSVASDVPASAVDASPSSSNSYPTPRPSSSQSTRQSPASYEMGVDWSLARLQSAPSSSAVTPSITLAARVRPFTYEEQRSHARRILSMNGDKLVLVNPSAQDADADEIASSNVFMHRRDFAQVFRFDHCFWSYDPCDAGDEYATQEAVHEALGKRLVSSVLSGITHTIVAYGHTGTGKTHSLFGLLSSPRLEQQLRGGEAKAGGAGAESTDSSTLKRTPFIDKQAGLAPRIIADIFSGLAERQIHDTKITLSFVEIYNDVLRDLLDEGSSPSSLSAAEPLRIREHPQRGVHVEGLTKLHVSSAEHALQALARGHARRTVASTTRNFQSSRSHAILTLELTPLFDDTDGGGLWGASPSAAREGDAPYSGSGVQQCVRAVLVDLAGSEKSPSVISSTSASPGGGAAATPPFRAATTTSPAGSGAVPGQQVQTTPEVAQKETRLIRRSLAALGAIIQSLKDGSQARSLYRDTTLTWFLRDVLSHQNNLTMLATLSPADTVYEETSSTLRYMERLNIDARTSSGAAADGNLSAVLRRSFSETASVTSFASVGTNRGQRSRSMSAPRTRQPRRSPEELRAPISSSRAVGIDSAAQPSRQEKSATAWNSPSPSQSEDTVTIPRALLVQLREGYIAVQGRLRAAEARVKELEEALISTALSPSSPAAQMSDAPAAADGAVLQGDDEKAVAVAPRAVTLSPSAELTEEEKAIELRRTLAFEEALAVACTLSPGESPGLNQTSNGDSSNPVAMSLELEIARNEAKIARAEAASAKEAARVAQQQLLEGKMDLEKEHAALWVAVRELNRLDAAKEANFAQVIAERAYALDRCKMLENELLQRDREQGSVRSPSAPSRTNPLSPNSRTRRAGPNRHASKSGTTSYLELEKQLHELNLYLDVHEKGSRGTSLK